MDLLLAHKNTIVLNQNVLNPFEESTTTTYMIPKALNSTRIILMNIIGEVIKTADISQPRKGQVNVFAKDISRGFYTYTLIVDEKTIETKKMIKH